MIKVGTRPPRQREGKAFPGGKILRKAHERLAVRRQGHEQIHADMCKRAKSVPLTAFKMPGSMK